MEEAVAYEAENFADAAGYVAWDEAGRPEGNWEEEVTNHDAPIQEHTISATGGSDKHTFYASLGYYNQEATVIGSNFERISGSLNLTQNISDSFEFSSSNTASHSFSGWFVGGECVFFFAACR